MEFRPCPSYPTYYTSIFGDVIRKRMINGELATRKRTAAYGKYISGSLFEGGRILVETLVDDAWPEIGMQPRSALSDRPASSYADGRVLTFEEWRLEKLAGTL